MLRLLFDASIKKILSCLRFQQHDPYRPDIHNKPRQSALRIPGLPQAEQYPQSNHLRDRILFCLEIRIKLVDH